MTKNLTKSELFYDFLVDVAQKGYASEAAQISRLDDGSHDLVIEQDGWRFHDNWFGGEPFGGREVISRGGKVFWLMTYFGSFSSDQTEGTKALREAMKQPANALPVRGPKEYLASNGLSYKFDWSGELARFSGVEQIFNTAGEKIYQAEVNGGLVDQ